MSASRKLIKTASFTGKAKRDGALSLFIVFLLGFNSQAYAASADIRTLATGELKEAISLKSAPTWVEHAATIAPITIEQQPKNEDTETRLTLSLEPFKARGITAMNDLKEFPLDHYGETYLYSLRMTSQKTAPLWQDLHYAYFGALAFSQQDGQLPFSSSAQSGSIRLHHFFLEAG
ncbi:MAG: hypothetical protein KDD61_03850, partial [Bdellovibrionales bacterium]|nr:hypothetical protein [Bdellovibrionales bacterium]